MLPQVLATPVMILMMENAALIAIRPYREAGESALGTAINVRHLAATPVGHGVRAEAEVTKVEGKRIEFKVSARDENEEIGNGAHQRMLIDLRSFNERPTAKGKQWRRWLDVSILFVAQTSAVIAGPGTEQQCDNCPLLDSLHGGRRNVAAGLRGPAVFTAQITLKIA